MNVTALWTEQLYQELVITIMAFLAIVGSIIYALQTRNPRLKASWASIKSWLFIAPIIFLMAGLPGPWPLILITIISIYSCKTFFMMVGMYHRVWFVLCTYLFVILSSVCIFYNYELYFNLLPAAFLAMICLIPIVKNDPRNMIQYIALSLLAFIFMGWSFIHLGFFLYIERGVYILLYIYVLSEFSETASVIGSRVIPKGRVFSNITSRFTYAGLAISTAITAAVAWQLRHILPNPKPVIWIAAAIVVSIWGRVGELILSIIRRDLGIKSTGVFIIGRNDILSRVDKMIFVGPLFYYIYVYLMNAPDL